MADEVLEAEKRVQEFIQSNEIPEFGAAEPILYKGCEFLPGLVTPESLDFIQKWKIPENSVFVATFPKTGSTFCLEVVRNILYLRDERILKMSKLLRTPLMMMIEMPPVKKIELLENLPTPRKYFFTHLPEEFFNYEEMKRSNSKVIYMIRNPKDQVVSWYNFTQKLRLDEELAKKLCQGWNRFFTEATNGAYSFGIRNKGWYPDHIKGWMKRKDDESFLLVEYEAMIENLPREVRRIAKHLEVELSDEDVERVAKLSSFDAVQKEIEMDKSGFLQINLRRGGVGGWKDWLTVTQSEMIDKTMEEKLGDTGIKFRYVL